MERKSLNIWTGNASDVAALSQVSDSALASTRTLVPHNWRSGSMRATQGSLA